MLNYKGKEEYHRRLMRKSVEPLKGTRACLHNRTGKFVKYNLFHGKDMSINKVFKEALEYTKV
jgi:hypothetical protein